MGKVVRVLAGRYGNMGGDNADDLIQEGMIGAVEAARTFDPERGVKFVTYARHRAHGRMQAYIRAGEFVDYRVRKAAESRGESAPRMVTMSVVSGSGADDLMRFDSPHHDPAPTDTPAEEFAEFVRGRFPGRATRDQIRLLADYYVSDRLTREIAAERGVSDSRVSQLMTEALSAILGKPKPRGMKCGFRHNGPAYKRAAL